MRLDEYLFYEKKTITDFAKELLITRNYLNLIVLGYSKPSKRLARDIEKATGGKVTVEELLKPKN